MDAINNKIFHYTNFKTERNISYNSSSNIKSDISSDKNMKVAFVSTSLNRISRNSLLSCLIYICALNSVSGQLIRISLNSVTIQFTHAERARHVANSTSQNKLTTIVQLRENPIEMFIAQRKGKKNC